MAKTIKFNLICDGHPIRNLEDLQNNFSIEDVLAYYENRLLHRWLRVRGYNEELKLIEAITSKDSIEIIKNLIRIFNVDSDEEKVEESVYILKYLTERKELFSVYKQDEFKVKEILDDYISGYHALVNEMLLNPFDAAVLKANIAELATNYAWALKLNHRELFYTLKESSFLAIMCLLMNENTRKFYLPIETVGEDEKTITDIDRDSDKREMYEDICKMVKTADLEASLKGHLASFAKVTGDFHDDVEPKGKKCMVISLGDKARVRSFVISGHVGTWLYSKDVENNFVILDGLQYQSSSEYANVYYMEV